MKGELAPWTKMYPKDPMQDLLLIVLIFIEGSSCDGKSKESFVALERC